jgi:capsular exopolysaccharide synthesis family protein
VELLDYVRVLYRRWFFIAISVLLGLCAAFLITVRTTPQYAASITMVVSMPDFSGNLSAVDSPVSPQWMASYADLMASRRLAGDLAASLPGLGLTPEQVRGRIQAEALPDTKLLRATVTDASPGRAGRIANMLGARFAHLVNEIQLSDKAERSIVKITVVDEAQPPQAPVSPRPLFNLGLGLLLGLLGGTAGAILRDLADTFVKSTGTLQEASGSPVLGTIAFERGAEKDPLIVQRQGDFHRGEAFRSLRTNLQFFNTDQPPRSIVITSSKIAEGKSTTACNLAIALAQAGRRVVLVDADLRRPKLTQYMGIASSPGLTSVLIGEAALADVLQPWEGEPLAVLPSGPIPPNPSELLSSENMKQTIGKLADFGDIVLIDAPGLLPVTDAAVLAHHCDGTLLVTRYGKTRREQVAQAVRRLNAVDARLLGCVLNFTPSKGWEYHHGYGYTAATHDPVESVRGQA